MTNLLFYRWGRTWLGTGPRALPDPVAIPGVLVHPSNESSRGSAFWRVGTLVQKRTQNTIRWCTFLFISGSLHSSQAEPPVQWLKGPAWLESCWGLQKCCRNQYLGNQAPHLESWRMQVYYAGRPRGVTLQVLSPEQRGYRVFIHEQAWLSGFARTGQLQRVRQGWVR